MKEIVSRLQENRQIELAKSILESHGYKVVKVQEAKQLDWKKSQNPGFYKGMSIVSDFYVKDAKYVATVFTVNSKDAMIGGRSVDKPTSPWIAQVRVGKEVITVGEDFKTSKEGKLAVEEYIDTNLNKSISEEETPRRSSGNWEEEMKTKAFPVGKDQINSFKRYLRSKGFRPDGKNYYVNDSTGDKVYIDQTWYGNYHVEPSIK